jgi:hypothetical protein
VLLFFIGAALGWWSVGWIWSFAACGVAVASVWGWKTLDMALQSRLKGMVIKALTR